MLRGLAVAAGALVLALAPNAWTPHPTVHAQSVSTIESGVWWIGQPRALPALPPPAEVPANGLWVSSTVAGTVAMSAVRFTVGANDRQPILTIPVETSTAPPATLPLSLGMPVLACPTTGKWKPPAKGTFGSLAAAPAYDCGKAQVLGAFSVDGKALVFELGSFVTETNSTVSVVLVPGAITPPLPAPPVPLPVNLPSLLIPPTFDVTFKPISPGAVEVLTTESFDDGTSDDAVVPETSTEVSGDRSFAAPTSPGVTAPAKPTGTRRIIASVPGKVAQVAAAAAHDAGSTRTRTIAALVFFDLCLWGWWASSRQPFAGTPQADRPYRTLYDGAVTAPARRRLSVSREGKPPPLR